MKKKRNIDSWFYANFIDNDNELNLNNVESEHLLKVFRAEINDEIIVSNGKGLVKNAIIKSISKKDIIIQLNDTLKNESKKPNLSIAIGFLKGKDLEEVIETCCQLNISDLYILHTDYSQELKQTNHSKLMQRLKTKSITALKQAHKAWLSEIHEAQEFADWLENFKGQIILLDPNGLKTTTKQINEEQCILIGPEGGLSPNEFKAAESKPSANGAKTYNMSLGNTRIRAKTAGVVALGKMC